MKIIINGAGIAGQTLAYWLLQYGFKPTVVEQAPRLRTGFDVAEKMGLIQKLMSKAYAVKELRLVDFQGRRCGGFSTRAISELTES